MNNYSVKRRVSGKKGNEATRHKGNKEYSFTVEKKASGKWRVGKWQKANDKWRAGKVKISSEFE